MRRPSPNYRATYAALPTRDEAVAEAARDRVVGVLRRLLVAEPEPDPSKPEPEASTEDPTEPPKVAS